jgi:hypothetical protein
MKVGSNKTYLVLCFITHTHTHTHTHTQSTWNDGLQYDAECNSHVFWNVLNIHETQTLCKLFCSAVVLKGEL